MPYNEDEGIGSRLVEPGGEDVDDVDDEKDVVARVVEDDDVEIEDENDALVELIGDDGEVPAEEAAMHITESP
jgi:hypothetical protein